MMLKIRRPVPIVVVLAVIWQASIGLAQPAGDEEPSPLLTEPATPEAMFNTVVLMVDLARPQLGREYLQQLLAALPANPAAADAVLMRIRDEHGPAVFLRLSNIEELQPQSVTLLNRMAQTFRRFASDPQRIDALIADLRGPAADRDAAILQLQAGGSRVVPRLLQLLGAAPEMAMEDLLRDTLTRLGPDAVPALLGALETPKPELKSAVIQALGIMRTAAAVDYLWHPAFASTQPPGVRASAREALARIIYGDNRAVGDVTASAASRGLERRAREHLASEFRWRPDADGTVTLWTWNQADATVRAVRVSPREASLYVGGRLAHQALDLLPETPRLHSLYLALLLARDQVRAGWRSSLPTGPGTAHDVAILAGSETVSDVLRQALKTGSPAAAIASLQVLRQTATRHALNVRIGAGSPVITALSYPDPRVQFAAMTVVLERDPAGPFFGSSRVVDILRRALVTDATAHAVVVDSDRDRGNRRATIIEQTGYRCEVVSTGRDGFRTAARRGDVEMIVLDAHVVRWDLYQTIANLRADGRTGGIPIVVIGTALRSDRVDRLRRFYPLLTYIVEPADAAAFDKQLSPFLSSVRSPPATPAELDDRRAAAVSWLAFLAEGHRHRLFDLSVVESELHATVSEPGLGSEALFALAAIPSITAQRRLLETALGDSRPDELREIAALHLAHHVQRHGALLRAKQVAELQAGWESAGDPALKTALAAVIGSLKPDRVRVGQRLRAFVPPAP